MSGTLQVDVGEILIDTKGRRPLRVFEIRERQIVVYDFSTNTFAPTTTSLEYVNNTEVRCHLVSGAWKRTDRIITSNEAAVEEEL